MSVERIVMAFAGVMIMLSLTLAHFFGEWWLLLAAFVGVNLIQSAFTGFCPAEIVLNKLGLGNGACCVKSDQKS